MGKCLCPNGPTVFHNGAGGDSTCMECGIVFSENTLVSEVTFGETSGGAAMAHGTLISEESTHARGGSRGRHAGGSESREQTLYQGRVKIGHLGTTLGIPDTIRDSAFRFYQLAVQHRFTKGRQSRLVVAACLYAACQHAKFGFFLIDFSDQLQVNVFVLGATYLKLIKILHMPRPYLMDPSHYIARFAALLEFGDETARVATDATRLVKRFRYDWMNTGRRPAGICGACLLLAARMNNFRRSVQEIVQVVKIADATLLRRLEEFKNTNSATMTVADFRDESKWLPESSEVPPIVKQQEKKRLKMLKRRRESEDPDQEDKDGSHSPDRGSTTPSTTQGMETVMSSATQVDPDSSTPLQIQPINLRRGIFEGVGLEEEDIRPSGITEPLSSRFVLEDNSIDAEGDDEEKIDEQAEADALFFPPDDIISPTLEPNQEEDEEGIGLEMEDLLHGDNATTVEAEIMEAEKKSRPQHDPEGFSDLNDEELDRFILTEEEVRLKTRVWVELNRDYLEKIALKGVDEVEGPKRKQQKAKKVRSKPRDSSTAQGATTAEAVGHLLKKKKFSRKINYDAVKSLFKTPNTQRAAANGWSDGPGDFEDDNGENKDDDETYGLISMNDEDVVDEGAVDPMQFHGRDGMYDDKDDADDFYADDPYQEEI